VYALSREVWLALVALTMLGAGDMVSVYVRHILVQLEIPDRIRGRVSAVNSVFIGASNELGEFESGLTAAWFGLIPSLLLGGVLSLVRSLADRLAVDGIRINSISPGQIRTPMLQPVIDALPPGAFERRILLGRLGEPIEIARAVRFLLSADASYITAAELVVDGGNISSQRM